MLGCLAALWISGVSFHQGLQEPPRLFVEGKGELGFSAMHLNGASGDLWLGDRTGGIFHLTSELRLQHSTSIARPGVPTASFATDAEGGVAAAIDWLGSLTLFDRQGEPIQSPALFPRAYSSVACDASADRLLLGAKSGSLTLMDRSGVPLGKFTPSQPSAPIESIWMDARAGRFCAIGGDGTLRFGTIEANSPVVRRSMRLIGGVSKACFSDDGRRLAFVTPDRSLCVCTLDTAEVGAKLVEVSGAADVTQVAFSPNGEQLAWGDRNGTVGLIRLGDDKPKTVSAHESAVLAVRFSSDGTRVMSASADGSAAVSRVPNLDRLALFSGQLGWVLDIVQARDPDRFVTLCSNDEVRIWSLRTGKTVATTYFWPSGEWACVAPDGRFDGSNAGHVEKLSWIISGQKIGLDQFAATYYTPGLQRSLLGVDGAPLPDLPKLDVASLPASSYVKQGSKIVVTVRNTGGGVGRVEVYVRDVRIKEFRPQDVEAAVQTFEIDLAAPEIRNRLLAEDREANAITVYATARDEVVRARLTLPASVEPETAVAAPKFFALAVGCDYPGSEYELAYPSADARAMANTLRAAATALPFASVEIKELWLSKAGNSKDRPTKQAILDAIRAYKGKVGASDVFVLYISGHGSARAGGKNGYYYLTSEAPRRRGDVETDPLASTYTVSGDELADALADSIYADKRVVILDTCAAGAAEVALAKDVSIETAQELRRFHDRSGRYMLAGAATNALSFESAALEHGLLTYALLEAVQSMDASATREGGDHKRYLDVERWLSYAENRVPRLLELIGSTIPQQPRKTNGTRANSFDLGVVDPVVAAGVALKSPKPTISWGYVVDDNDEDPLGLEAQLRTLTAPAGKGAARLGLAAKGSRNASLIQVNVKYKSVGSGIEASVSLQRFVGPGLQVQTVKRLTFAGPASEIAEIILQGIIPAAEQVWLARPKP